VKFWNIDWGEFYWKRRQFFQIDSRRCHFSHITVQEELDATTTQTITNGHTRRRKEKQYSQTVTQ